MFFVNQISLGDSIASDTVLGTRARTSGAPQRQMVQQGRQCQETVSGKEEMRRCDRVRGPRQARHDRCAEMTLQLRPKEPELTAMQRCQERALSIARRASAKALGQGKAQC